MYLMHYILPIAIFYFWRNKAMLFGLVSANLIDLDHVYLRLIGKAAWFKSSCPSGLGTNCSFTVYPLHNIYFILPAIALSVSAILLYRNYRDKRLIFLFWLGLGFVIHLSLDYVHLITGFAV